MSMVPGGMTALKETKARSRVVSSPLCFWWGGRELAFERRPAGRYLGRQQVQRPPGMPVLAGVKASDGVGGGQRGWSLDSKDEGDQR